MAFDWTTVMDSQEAGLESLLARRDMSKQMQQLLATAVQAENQRENRSREGLLDRQITENTALREQQQAALEAERQKAAARAQADDDRMRTSQLLGRPAGTVFQQPEVEFLTKQGFAGDLTPAGAGSATFRRQEAERVAAKLAQDEKFEQENQERERKRLELAQKADQRAEQEAQRRVQREDRARQAHEKRMAQMAKSAETIVPVHLRQQFNKSVEDRIKASKAAASTLVPWDDEEEALSREGAMLETLEEWRQKRLVPQAIVPPFPGGRQSGSGRQQGQQQETPEQRRNRLLGR